jgi:hypothetical protein
MENLTGSDFDAAAQNLQNLSKQPLGRILKYTERTAQFIVALGAILLVNGSIKKLKWYNVATLWAIGKIAVEFVKDIKNI